MVECAIHCCTLHCEVPTDTPFIVHLAVVPGKPTELTADKTCRSITVKWKPPKDNGHSPILQYVIGYEGGQHNRPEREREYLVPVTFKPSTDNVIKIRARNIVGVGLPAKITVRTAEFCKYLFVLFCCL